MQISANERLSGRKIPSSILELQYLLRVVEAKGNLADGDVQDLEINLRRLVGDEDAVALPIGRRVDDKVWPAVELPGAGDAEGGLPKLGRR